MTIKKSGGGHAYPGGQFDEVERAQLRRMLDEDDKMRWMWAKLRFWAVAVGGGAAAIVAFRDSVGEILRGLLR